MFYVVLRNPQLHYLWWFDAVRLIYSHLILSIQYLPSFFSGWTLEESIFGINIGLVLPFDEPFPWSWRISTLRASLLWTEEVTPHILIRSNPVEHRLSIFWGIADRRSVFVMIVIVNYCLFVGGRMERRSVWVHLYCKINNLSNKAFVT
jgi:hypothetical protein